jgi:branched-chain amino acid transport system ATP-binding protein
MADVLLETRGVSKGFGGVQAVSDVSLRLAPGELRCIIGPNGAGKSTLFKLLLGSVRPDAGTILFEGVDVTRLDPHRRAHLGMGIKFQNFAVYDALTVRHNLLLPLRHRHLTRALDEEMARLLARLNLSGTEDRIVATLAHGQKQWLAIGMALAMQPKLLLLDEPTAGMGPEETRSTGELIQSVNAEGVGALVVEHDMAVVRQLRAPVTVMHYGRIFAEGTLSEIESHEDVRKIYLGAATLERRRRARKA